MDFWKMNGAGNDFIIIDDRAENIDDKHLSHIAARLCQRQMSIGADGLMVVRPARQGGDFRMLFFNADGSEAEMCGNGSRCICRYGFENGLAGQTQRVETASGMVEGVRLDARHYRVRLNPPTVLETQRLAEVEGTVYPCTYVELGSPGLPHAAVVFPDLRTADKNGLRGLGRALRYHPAFPKGANITFYERSGPASLYALTYERGVEDFTLACGTGAGSAAAALMMRGELDLGRADVEMPGGTLTIDVMSSGDNVTGIYLTGPTNIVCKGTVTDEELDI